MTPDALPQSDTILTGPIWPGPVRVLRCTASDRSVRIEAVGVGNSQYYDRTLTLDQFQAEVSQLLGGTHTFDADPALRLATEALRIHLAHSFDPQFAVSVSQVDPLPHQLDAVYTSSDTANGSLVAPPASGHLTCERPSCPPASRRDAP